MNKLSWLTNINNILIWVSYLMTTTNTVSKPAAALQAPSYCLYSQCTFFLSWTPMLPLFLSLQASTLFLCQQTFPPVFESKKATPPPPKRYRDDSWLSKYFLWPSIWLQVRWHNYSSPESASFSSQFISSYWLQTSIPTPNLFKGSLLLFFFNRDKYVSRTTHHCS